MAPLASSTVLPDGWSEHHRPSAEGFLTGTCRADRPGQPVDWEPGADPPDNQNGKVWGSLPCSVQILTGTASPTVVVDSVEVIASHRISVPLSAVSLQYKDFLTITDNPDDPLINGRQFTVLLVEKGTTNWTREYLCQERNTA